MRRTRFMLLTALLTGAVALGLAARHASAADEPVAAGETGKHPLLVIGLDLSKSNPMVTSDAYAQRVADRVAPMVEDLPLRARVMIRSFGSYDATSNTLRIDELISARTKPEDFARGVKTLIAGVPKLVRDGKLVAQDKTNILPFLQTMSQVVDCDDYAVTYILLTDGIEDSEYARLAYAGNTLPPPSHSRFQSCEELQILGLGQGLNSPKATERLRNTWDNWATAAGFGRFLGLYDW